MNPIEYYTWKFPQLTLGVGKGMSESEEYKNIVRRGIFPEELNFPLKASGEEELIELPTPAGMTEVLYLPDRKVFEYFLKVLAYKCEDVEIPKAMGAMLISGIISWRKIFKHQEEFLKDHGISEWGDEFDRFTKTKENYLETVLLISKGNYSAVPASDVGYSDEEWISISKDIRKYHETTHYICRKLYPEHKQAVRDEVIADCIGLFGATGKYDTEIAKKILGIYDGKFVEDGRLTIYVEKDKIEENVSYCLRLIEKLEAFCKDETCKPFELLLKIEDSYVDA